MTKLLQKIGLFAQKTAEPDAFELRLMRIESREARVVHHSAYGGPQRPRHDHPDCPRHLAEQVGQDGAQRRDGIEQPEGLAVFRPAAARHGQPE